jgi:hypothetical protein
MRTEEPTAPTEGAIAVISGVTVKFPPVPTTPETVTEIGPVVAPTGTGATMVVLLQLVGAAGIPLKLTTLDTCVLPNPLPLIVTAVPTGPTAGDTLVIVAGIVNVSGFEFWLATVTINGPVVAFVGTGTAMLESLQVEGVPATPLNVTVLDPCDAPKFPPAIVTLSPALPVAGVALKIYG